MSAGRGVLERLSLGLGHRIFVPCDHAPATGSSWHGGGEAAGAEMLQR
jgi:hypothetical protein